MRKKYQASFLFGHFTCVSCQTCFINLHLQLFCSVRNQNFRGPPSLLTSLMQAVRPWQDPYLWLLQCCFKSSILCNWKSLSGNKFCKLCVLYFCTHSTACHLATYVQLEKTTTYSQLPPAWVNFFFWCALFFKSGFEPLSIKKKLKLPVALREPRMVKGRQ